MNWKEWVDESVEFYKGRINQLNAKLSEKKLSEQQRSILQSEKRIAIEERTKWKKIQRELNIVK